MQSMTSQEIGTFGETVATHYLRFHGYTVKTRNYRAGHYEIDIIASTVRDIAFVEVKTRTCSKEELAFFPPPQRAVDRTKQHVTRRAAQQYLYEHPTKKRPRMDVIEIWLEPRAHGKPRVLRLNHIKAAY